MTIPDLQNHPLILYRKLTNTDLTTVVATIEVELAKEGFGILSTIDIQSILKQKLDKEERPYLILGACHPEIAHQALSTLPAIGALLPCNIIVSESDDSSIVVGIVNPETLFSMLSQDNVASLAQMVKEKLGRVLKRLS